MTKVLRDLREGELTIKDMSSFAEGDSAKIQHKKTSGTIRDYSLQHTITIGWGGGYVEPNRDLLPFQLLIDDRPYVLSWAELKDMDRGGFFRREEGNPQVYELRFYDGPKFTLDVLLNEEAQRDMIFRFEVDGKEMICDWYEFLRFGRFI